MNFNITNAASWATLPANIQALLASVTQGALSYPERHIAWQRVHVAARI